MFAFRKLVEAVAARLEAKCDNSCTVWKLGHESWKWELLRHKEWGKCIALARRQKELSKFVICLGNLAPFHQSFRTKKIRRASKFRLSKNFTPEVFFSLSLSNCFGIPAFRRCQVKLNLQWNSGTKQRLNRGCHPKLSLKNATLSSPYYQDTLVSRWF